MKNKTIPIHGRVLFSVGIGVHGVRIEMTQRNPEKSLLETVTDVSGWFAGELQSNELCELIVRVFDGLGRELIAEKITVSDDLASISQSIKIVVTDQKNVVPTATDLASLEPEDINGMVGEIADAISRASENSEDIVHFRRILQSVAKACQSCTELLASAIAVISSQNATGHYAELHIMTYNSDSDKF